MTPADNPTQGTGVEQAAQAFEDLLSGKAGKQTPNEGQPAEDAEADEAEALEATDAEEDAPSDEEGSEEEDAADQDEEEGRPLEDLDRLVTVTVDGKAEQIPLREALAGYQRQSDYTRKTQELGEERRSFYEERDAVRVERAQYGQLLGALQQQLQYMQTVQQPDWEKLYNEDPIQYVRERENWRDMQERISATQAEMQRVQAAQAAEREQAMSNLVQVNRGKLLETMPQWKDKSRWDQDRAKIKEYGQTVGFSAQELAQVYDHRAVVTLWKAMRYDEMQSKRPKPSTSKAPAPAPAGTPSSAPRSTNDLTRAKQRLAKTGRVRDAAAIFEKII
jgi:hypothetical protein